MDVDRFNELPLELKEYIITQNPQLIPIFFQSNKEYNELLRLDFLRNICQQSISTIERAHVFDTQKITGMRFRNININQSSPDLFMVTGYMMIRLDILDLIQGEGDILAVSIEFNDSNGVNLYNLSNDINGILERNANEQLDLLTYFTIMSNRLSCMRIKPDFAKSQTLTMLDNYETYYNQIKNEDATNLKIKIDLIDVYTYLFMNSYVFNVSTNTQMSVLENILDNIDDIKRDIGHMFTELRQKIMKL